MSQKTIPQIEIDGDLIRWTHQEGDQYHVTGVDAQGKRFKKVTDNPHYALGFNLHRGTIWLVRADRRVAIRRTYN
jgi:hypothetical protein